ncbi:MAG TPA: hypothetical protein VFF27_07255 [Bacteroidia bacterium]|jgi:tetratricopeptide (TPR) repeat protein|nr:hypothetical protein [Bacteroidia bacterium]
MKKIAILLLIVLPLMTAFSQNAKVTNAINYLKAYKSDNSLESLQKAKENIDLVSQNPEFKDQPKVLKLKGDIYVELFESNLQAETKKLSSIADPGARSLAAYKATPTAELDEAATAYAAAKANDKKGIYALEVSNGNVRILNHYFNKGNGNFNDQKFADALQMYEKASALDETNDTSLLNNMAASALYAKDFAKSKANYSKMAELKVGGASTYNSLVHSYFNLKDTTGGMDVLKKGRTLYPGDGDLLNTETNYYLAKNKSEEALKNLNVAITARPQEATLYLVRGGVYDKMANPVDANGKDLPKPANVAELMKSSEADYKKAISIYETAKPENAEDAEQLKISYSSALFNLGIIYFNNGANISKSADKITDNAKFAAENKKANEEFNKALPYLEKAHQLKPDAQTVYALKQIYTRLEMTAKLKTLNDGMKN